MSETRVWSQAEIEQNHREQAKQRANELDRQLGALLSGPAADQLAHVPPEERIRRLNKCFAAKDARIAELEAVLSDVRTILHNEALNQPVNSLYRWVGLYKRIDKLLSKGE